MGEIFFVLIVIFLLTVGISYLEDYFKVKYNGQKTKELFVLRFLALLLTLLADFLIFHEITSRIMEILYTMRYYIVLLISFFLVLYRMRLSIKFYEENPRLKGLLIVVGSIFSIIFSYLIIISYSHSLYKIIPMDRGGKLPVSYATISLREAAIPLLDEFKDYKKMEVYIIEHTTDSIFFVKKTGMLYEEPKDKKLIYNIRRDDISSMIIHPHQE
jgi:magnesium-transporting ATPase (P-type)